MNSRSASFAKTLLLLAIVIASISAWWGYTQREKSASAQLAFSSAKKALDTARADNATASALPPGDAPLKEIGAAFSELQAELSRAPQAYKVSVDQMTAGQQSGATQPTLKELAPLVAGAPLRSLRMEIRGNYADYDRFLSFINRYNKHPTTRPVSLQVDGLSFVLVLRVFAKE